MAAYTPNMPWARFGCPDTIDQDGGGTSAATPQIAAAAALWMQKNKAAWTAMREDWMRVEAMRKALFGSGDKDGRAQPFRQRPAAGERRARARAERAGARAMQPKDDADFASFMPSSVWARLAAPSAQQRMLELEALQMQPADSHSIRSRRLRLRSRRLRRRWRRSARSQALRDAFGAVARTCDRVGRR